MTDYGSGVLGPLGGRVVDDPLEFATTRVDGVWAFGDSILRNDADHLRGLITTRLAVDVAIDGQGSRTTTGCVDALEAQVTAHGQPSRVILAGGTNDIFDPPVMAAQLARVRELVPFADVIWPTVYVRRWGYSTTTQLYDTQNTGWVNDQIHEAAGGDARMHLVRWFEYLCRPNSSGNLNRPGQCLSDGVHTSLTGRIARNTLIVNAIPEVA